MKSFILTLSLILISITTFSQGKIRGTVIEKSQETLPFATVMLKDTKKSLIEGTVTDEKGNFNFENIKLGNYILEIQYVGYETLNQEITLTKDKNNLNLNKIVLNQDAQALDEVVVEGSTSEVSLKLGKKVFTVGKDITSQSGSATDVLGNVPSVNVSPSGAISLRGNENVQVLINGRRSALTQSQALEQISSDLIEKVEVITSPSASYDASGSSGIINIILKKNRKSGLNGQLQAVAGIPDDYRLIGNLNYRAKKFNFFTNMGIRYTDYEGEYSRNQTTQENGVTTFLNQYEDENRHDDGRLFYFGTDYFMNDKNTFTVAYYRNETKDTDETFLNYDYSITGNITSKLKTKGNSKEKRDYNQLEANYTKTFEKKGQKLTVDFQYDFWNSNKKWELDTDEIFPLNQNFANIRTIADNATDDYVLQSDFKTPLSKNSNLEIGAKYEDRTISNKFLAEEFNGNQFETIDDLDNALDYSEKIVAGYAQFNSKLDKFSYQLGLRLENTNTAIKSSDVSKNLKNNYINLFPSATVSYKLNDNLSGQLSYSKRISRPSLWDLSPFFELKDFTSRYTGNPELQPAFTDAFELSFLFSKNKLRLNPSIYYHKSKDILEYQTVQNSDDVFILSPINLDNDNRYGFELSASYKVAKWFSLAGDFNAFKFEQKGTINNKYSEFSDSNWFTNLTANISPSKTLRIQTRYTYQGQNNNAQTKTKPVSNLNIGIRKNLFKNKASLLFNVSNVFNSRKLHQNTQGENFTINSIRNRNAQRYSVSFIYKFNQKPSDKNRRAKRSNRY